MQILQPIAPYIFLSLGFVLLWVAYRGWEYYQRETSILDRVLYRLVLLSILLNFYAFDVTTIGITSFWHWIVFYAFLLIMSNLVEFWNRNMELNRTSRDNSV